MLSFEEQINNLLYQGRKKAISLVRAVSVLNIGWAIVLLIYRYGFILSREDINWVLEKMNWSFAIVCLAFLVRMLFVIHRREFIQRNWIEGTLIALVLVNGMLNIFFGFRPLLALLEAFGVELPFLLYQHLISIYLILLIGLEFTKVSTRISDLELNPATTFIFSFILLIGIGTFLLMLPAMTAGDSSMRFLDALFTSVSASCVTGLAIEDTATFFTFKGHLVIMMLIQIGGIGIVSFATFFASFLAKGVGLKQQSIIQDYLSSDSLIGATSLLRRVIVITLIIEFLGFIFIFFSWDDNLKFNSTSQKVFFSIFHSISAFCNAGFSLFTDSLYTLELADGNGLFQQPGLDLNLRRMYMLHFVIAILIILGGLGFSTIEDVFSPKNIKDRFISPWKNWSITSRITVYSSGILLLLGTVGFMILEVHQLTDRTIIEALSTSFFQSVTTRTAGFNSMDFGSMASPTIILCLFLMFIGASPGSTGGGIKTSTFFLIAISSIANIQGRQRIEFARRTIPNDLIHKAFSIFMFATTYNLIAVFLLTITEAGNEDITIIQLVFEQISAFATVGLSMGITSDLSDFGKVVIIISMYIGRVGTLTLALALSSKVKTNSYQYPNTHVMVG